MAVPSETGRRPDQQNIEPQLPQPEVGNRASELIQAFKQAIGDMPESPFRLIRGDKPYDVSYRTSPEGEKLIMQQYDPGSRPEPFLNPYLGQFISLGTEVNEQSHEIDGGEIMHSNVHLYRPESATNTRTAVQRVEYFLEKYFPKPQPQTPPQK
jgi:hypothetical protein